MIHPKRLAKQFKVMACLGIAILASIGVTIVSSQAYAQVVERGKPLKAVRFADQIGSEVDYAHIWVAEALGYFAEEGIRIERKTYSSGPEGLLHFANGEIDMMVGGLAPFMQAAARGQDFKMLLSVTKYNAPLVGRKEFKSYKDLDGRKVGTPGLGTVQDAVLAYVEKTQGLKFQRIFAKVSDFAVMAEKREIDAFISWEPAAALAIRQNPQLHYVAQLPPIKNAESLQLIAHPSFVKQNPDVVYGFIRATIRGMHFIQNNPAEKVAEIVAKKMNDPSAVPVVLSAMKSVLLTDPRVDMPSTRLILQAIIDAGKIPATFGKDIDKWMAKYLDYSFLENAEKSLR
jgi:NitT/TauT family transport system substrate-binding protein